MAAIQRLADGALCFQVNSGQFVAAKSGYLNFVDGLSNALGFALTNTMVEGNSFTQIVLSTDSKQGIGESQGALVLISQSGEFFEIQTFVVPLSTILAKKNGDALNLTYVDFTGIDFSGCSLNATDFSNCNLSNAVFFKANLSNANLFGAVLASTNFTGATILGTKFDYTDLSSANFGPAPHMFHPPVLGPPSTAEPRTSFVGATLPVSLLGLDWSMLDLSGARLSGTLDLSGLSAQYAVLAGNGLGLEGATLAGVNFSHSDVSIDLSNCKFAERLGDPASTFEGATLHNSNFSGAKLVGANFKGAQGSRTGSTPGTNFSSAYMVNAVLTEASFVKATFANAQLYGTAMLDHADLQEADFSNSILSGLNLNEARLRGAKFDAANLINASLKGVDLTPTMEGNATNLIGANLIGTNFEGAQLNGANLDSAEVALREGVPFFSLTDLASWVADLNNNQISVALSKVFASNGRPLRPYAVAYTLTPGSRWGIEQYPTYDVALDARLNQLSVAVESVVLFTLPSSAALVAALDVQTLPQELVSAITSGGTQLASTAAISVVTAGSSWSLSQLPSVDNAVGYSSLALVGESGNLDAFGTKLMIGRLGDRDKMQLEIVDVVPTVLTSDAMGPDTVCPNQSSYAQNVANNTSWLRMMTARTPAAPPSCVPSPDRWCPPSNAIYPTGLGSRKPASPT
jgi:uncharacterized protein YjbI with pentapeptide repeats